VNACIAVTVILYAIYTAVVPRTWS